MLKHACNLNLEGIVSKRADAPYRSGRSGDWLKTKCSSNQEFVVIGYEPSDKRGRLIRSLLLGYYDEGRAALRRAGRHRLGPEGRSAICSSGSTPVARKDTPLDKIPPEERRRGVNGSSRRSWSRSTSGLDRRQAGAPGLVQGRARGQAGEAGGARGRTDAATTIKQAALRQKSPTKTAARRKSRKIARRVDGRRRDAQPSRPRLLGGCRRHQADAGRILHAGLGLDARRM